MELLGIDSKSAEIKTSIDDLHIINQSLKVVFKEIDLFEFHARLGVSKENFCNLMGEIKHIIDKIDDNPETD
jgi:hypothetical protein